MKGHKFRLRETWTQLGGFHPFTREDIEDQEKSNGICDMDELQIITPYGYVIDLSWYGQDRKTLTGQVIKFFDWDNPVEKKELKTYEDAISWVDTWITKIEKIEDDLSVEEKKAILERIEELEEEFELRWNGAIS